MAPWTLPKFFLQTASLVQYPDWETPMGTLDVDIQPTGGMNALNPGHMPQEPGVPWSHWGFVENPSPITKDNPSKYRLVDAKGNRYVVLRLRDWDGFTVMDLDEVTGT